MLNAAKCPHVPDEELHARMLRYAQHDTSGDDLMACCCIQRITGLALNPVVLVEGLNCVQTTRVMRRRIKRRGVRRKPGWLADINRLRVHRRSGTERLDTLQWKTQRSGEVHQMGSGFPGGISCV